MENRSLIHYIKPTYERIFIQVDADQDNKEDEAVFSLIAFNEKQLDKDPYTEISFQGHSLDGNVKIDTENQEISFDPIRINSTYD
jgi:hypothetical protein